MMVRGSGIYLWDNEGNAYMDGSSGPVTCSIGHGNARVIAAMHQQAQTLAFSFPSSARNPQNIALAEKLTRLAGTGAERALFVSGGSEAIDMAIKFCRQYRYATGEKQRVKLISCSPSYHGMTLAALTLSGDPVFGEIFGDMAGMAHHIPAANAYHRPPELSEHEYVMQCASALETTIIEQGAESVLAFFVEPVGGSSTGAIAPPAEYFREIRRICSHYGVFLVYDEVMSGAGRTGTFLTSHRWPDARPDITVLAKGLGAGYMPLGAMLAPAALVEELAALTGFNYAHTYNASPLACAVGGAVLDEIVDNALVENAELMGLYLRSQLEIIQAQSSIVGDVRGRGLLLGLELVANKLTRLQLPAAVNVVDRLREHARQRGLLLYGRRSNGGVCGEAILVAPPLTITLNEVDILIERLKQALQSLENELHQERYI